MSMFCFQCQETVKNKGCTVKGVCGKGERTSNLQDLLIYALKGISFFSMKAKNVGERDERIGRFLTESLFVTITNANFDDEYIIAYIKKGLKLKEEIKNKFVTAYREKYGEDFSEALPDAAKWYSEDVNSFYEKAEKVGVLETADEDVRSLRELLVIGVKGISAYTNHAAMLGYKDDSIYDFVAEALDSTLRGLSVEEMIGMVNKAGDYAVKAMALLDKAHTNSYGHPEITKVDTGVRSNPGILISGHDLKDIKELLEQTKGTGVDVYTHCEMLPANYYPEFKKYDNLAGNYGSSWWRQNKEFEAFNGPILMTTNCIIPVKDSYKDRIFTTGVVGYKGVKHIPEGKDGKEKDFSEIIELAKKSKPPEKLESGTIVGGFAHNQVEQLADKIVEAVKSGAIKKFVVMAGCDGRSPSRSYFTEVAEALPKDTVILTAGCAKYRYNKLDLGNIDGIPRVLDAGQCNDSYSLALVALKLKEIFKAEDVNDLPISFDIAWYEQKAVTVLLALFSVGFKHIRLGPTLPAFLSPNVTKVLVDKFDIRPTGDVKEDVKEIIS